MRIDDGYCKDSLLTNARQSDAEDLKKSSVEVRPVDAVGTAVRKQGELRLVVGIPLSSVTDKQLPILLC